MPTSRPFAYNTGSTIDGTEQVGNLAVGIPTNGFASTGLQWWMGPDEDLGYVIAYQQTSGTQPNPLSIPAYVQFWRSSGKTDQDFINLAKSVIKTQNFTGTTEVKTYLNNNGYWTSYSESTIIQDRLFMELDASNYIGGLWNDETNNGNNATINGATWVSTDGGIFDLDGINDNISIPHVSNLSLNTTTQKTIQVWVKFDVLPNFNQQVPVFGKLSNSFGFDGYWGGLFSNEGVVRVVTNGTAVQRISNSTLKININTWYLFTFISQITSTSNTTKVYINSTEYISSAHGSDTYNESNPLYLGFIGSGVSSLYLNGKIGACYFYTKGLNESEVLNNYNVTKSKYGL